METTLDTLVIRIRGDMQPFRSSLDNINREANASLNHLANSASNTSDIMSNALTRFARRGKLDFSDLRSVAISSLRDILAQITGFGGLQTGPVTSGFGGIFGALAGPLINSVFRANGGPVAPGFAHIVGERGRELFIPSVPGAIVPNHQTLGMASSPGRSIVVNINMTAANSDPVALRQSAGQIAASVRRALAKADRNL